MYCEVLHVAGDVVKGKLNHKGQHYNAFPPDIQQWIAFEAIMKLIETVKPREVHVLPGNHDREHSINLLDNVVAELKERM